MITKIINLLLGVILNDVLTRMEASMNKLPTAKKMYLHVGHDSTIIPFLKTLNIDNITFPLYGAAIIMELYATPSNTTVVKVNNNNQINTIQLYNEMFIYFLKLAIIQQKL